MNDRSVRNEGMSEPEGPHGPILVLDFFTRGGGGRVCKARSLDSPRVYRELHAGSC